MATRPARANPRSCQAMAPVRTSVAVTNAGPKSPLDAYTRSPRRMIEPKCTRSRLEAHSSVTVVLPPACARRSPRLPPL